MKLEEVNEDIDLFSHVYQLFHPFDLDWFAVTL